MDGFEKMIAEADQAGESVKLIAPVMFGYFDALLKQGFTRAEALQLTIAYQNAVFKKASN